MYVHSHTVNQVCLFVIITYHPIIQPKNTALLFPTLNLGLCALVSPEIDFLTREWAALTMVCCFKKLLWNVKDDLQSVRHKSRLHSGGQWPNVFLAGKMSDRCSSDFGQSSIRRGRLENGPHGPKIQIVGTMYLALHLNKYVNLFT